MVLVHKRDSFLLLLYQEKFRLLMNEYPRQLAKHLINTFDKRDQFLSVNMFIEFLKCLS